MTKANLLEYLEMRVKAKILKYQEQINVRKKLDKDAKSISSSHSIYALREILEEIDDCYDNLKIQRIFHGDENAETLEDKLRDEHHNISIPEEREDANLFETMAEKFRPKIKEE